MAKNNVRERSVDFDCTFVAGELVGIYGKILREIKSRKSDVGYVSRCAKSGLGMRANGRLA